MHTKTIGSLQAVLADGERRPRSIADRRARFLPNENELRRMEAADGGIDSVFMIN